MDKMLGCNAREKAQSSEKISMLVARADNNERNK